jgi:hypothetical protein
VPTVTLPPWPSDFGEPRIAVDDGLAVEVIAQRHPRGDHGIEIVGDAVELLAASDGFEEEAAVVLTAAMRTRRRSCSPGLMRNPEGVGLRAEAGWFQRAARRIRGQLA